MVKFIRNNFKKFLPIGFALIMVVLLAVNIYGEPFSGVLALEKARLIFQEARQWQIASDQAAGAGAGYYQFTPTSGNLVLGTEQTITSATAASTEGVNVGSWQGTLADDNFHWVIASTATGYNLQLNLDGVQLNGANKMLIQTEIDLDATAPSTLFQICDWVSSTNVDHAADGTHCTGGGWRTLNTKDASQAAVAFTGTTAASLQWHIYDGYWSTGTTGGTPISTPLSNFIRTTDGRVKIRYFSTTNTTSQVSIDFLRIIVIVDSVYHPASFTQISGGTPSGHYGSTVVVGNDAAAQQSVTTGDGIRLSVPGTASVVSDFYLSFRNVKTYTGMNTIYVKADYSCSATGINHRPKIWNFTTSSWEDLTTASIACSTTDATNAWAKNNITITDYVQGGEVRIGWRGLSANTQSIRLDYIYIILGSTNTDSSQCEVSFGTGTATDCTNARDLDLTGTSNLWTNPTEDESGTFSHPYYPFDTDMDATVEEAASSNLSFPVTPPSNAAVVGAHFAGRFTAGTGLTVQLGLRDYSGLDQASGGWTAIGATAAATTALTDSITALGIATYGRLTNPEDYLDTVNNRMNLRLRTTSAGATTNNASVFWDFAMVSLMWIEVPSKPTKIYQFTPTSGNLVLGTEQTITSATAASTEGVNVGSWQGTLADDNFHWVIASTATGYNLQLNLDGVQLNGANKMLIQTEIDLDATAPSTLFQICDWVSSTNVDAPADAQCTGGGWRTLNTKDASQAAVAFTGTTAASLQWHIYDGYWSTGTTGGTPISTPLSNFIRTTDGRVKIRYFSTTNTTSQVSIDFLRIFAIVDSVYHPASFTQISGGTPAGHYGSTMAVGNTASAQQPATGDGIRLSVPGTASVVSDFYLSFRNVKTYTGMNTIYVNADYSCSATGINHRPKIWNFTTSSWEDLTTASIACSTTDATNAWAKNNITITDYVQGGEVRIGWRGLSADTQSIRLDYIYIILGSTNTDSSQCEVSFGTGTATDCTNARDLDPTGTSNLWTNPTEDESGTFSHPYYPFDTDMDATVEEAASSNLSFPVTPPSNAAVVGAHFAGRFTAGTGLGVQLGLRDYSGLDQASGGWTAIGATAVATTILTDSIIILSIATYGRLTNPEDYLDTYNNRMNLRLRTTSAGATTNNASVFWDFAMVSLMWIETVVPNQPPSVSNVLLNNQNNISLVENITVTVSATANVYDAQGCNTITNVQAKIYRSGVSGFQDCTTNANNCYSVTACTETSCSGTNAVYTCTIQMQFHADPTDNGTPWASEYWRAWIKATDSGGLSGEAWSPVNAPEVLSLVALDVTSSINYGNLAPGQKNDPLDKITTVTATGNVSLDVILYGTNMTSGGNSIPVGKQKYALSANTSYASGTSLLLDPGAEAELNCPKTTDASNPQTRNVWWGIEIPIPQPTANYSGVNTFIGVKNELPWP